MPINRKIFFDTIRDGRVFLGTIPQAAVNGINAILTEWERRKLTNLDHLAYMLATVRAETGENMLPVRECFAKTDREARNCRVVRSKAYGREKNGHVYYGRGLVQLTWDFNYRNMSVILGIDLLNNPDKALDPGIAAKIMFEGMYRGTFTGQKLDTHINAQKVDFRNARRIINGMDRADEIAGFAREFQAALKKASVPTISTEEVIVVGGGTVGGGVVVKTAVDAGFSNWEIGAMVIGGILLISIVIAVIRKVKNG